MDVYERFYIYKVRAKAIKKSYLWAVCDACRKPLTIARFKRLIDAQDFLALIRQRYRQGATDEEVRQEVPQGFTNQEALADKEDKEEIKAIRYQIHTEDQ